MKRIKIGNLGKDKELFNLIASKERAINKTIDRLTNEQAQCDMEQRRLLYKHSKRELREKYDSLGWDDETGDIIGTVKEIGDDYQMDFIKELVDQYNRVICKNMGKKQ